MLNADYTPLSFVPLSLWSWQDTVSAVFRDIVTVVSEYDVEVSSPSITMQLPSVIVLKKYVGRTGKGVPCFTRRNLVRTRDSNPRPLPRTSHASLALPLQTAKGREFESHARSSYETSSPASTAAGACTCAT